MQVLKLDAQMQELAEELKHESSLLVFGRGYNYATALEAALKVPTHTCNLVPMTSLCLLFSVRQTMCGDCAVLVCGVDICWAVKAVL